MAQHRFQKRLLSITNWKDKADRVKEAERYDHRIKTKMARAFVMDAGDKNSSSSYMLAVQRMEKTKSTKKDRLNTIKHDLPDMKLTWQEAEVLATNKSEWCRHMTLCIFDAI